MAIFDGKLKQRLIGAVVLIVLAVVFLPMIFNNKGENVSETVVDVPAHPLPPQVPAAPMPTPANSVPAIENNQPTSTQQPQANPVENQVTTTNLQTTSTTEPVTTPQPKNTTESQPTASQPNNNGITPTWSIQLAAVSNLKNAEAFSNKLRKANYNAYIRSEGNIHRVFVGPVIDKNEAVRIQQQIQKRFNEKGIVKEFKPESR